MSDEQTNQSSEETSASQKPLNEGHQPVVLIKGHQPVPMGDLIIGGYAPEISNLNPQNPPQGGSGVPAAQSSPQNSGGGDTGGGDSGGAKE